LIEGDMILIFELWNLHQDTLLFGTMTFDLMTFTQAFDLCLENFSQGYIFLKKVDRVLIFAVKSPFI
jgi:hypothetical protein